MLTRHQLMRTKGSAFTEGQRKTPPVKIPSTNAQQQQQQQQQQQLFNGYCTGQPILAGTPS